ncbi:predicted protein, partial [Nematostella vectensis]
VISSLLLGLLIVSENLFVCYIVYRFRRLRTYTNGFVASLAVSDILFGAVLVPLHVFVEHSPVNSYLIAIILMVNIANLLLCTFDRYLAVLKPFHYATHMAKIFHKVIVLAWLVPIFVGLLPLFWDTDPARMAHTIYLFCTLAIGILIPYLLILFAYVRIFREVQKQVRKLAKISLCDQYAPSFKEKKKMASEVRVAKVFAVIAGIFVLSWMPLVFMNAADALHVPQVIPESLPVIAWYTLNFSSMINAPIYAFFKSDFRRALKTILVCK